jgi:hypothetical protein
MLARSEPETALTLLRLAQDDVNRNWHVYQNRAAAPGQPVGPKVEESQEPPTVLAKQEDEQ